MTKKILCILMPKDFKDIEFFTPYNLLLQQGYTVDVAGFAQGNAHGTDGAIFTPNKLLTQLTEQDFAQYDALVIPGGPGCITYLWNNKNIQQVVTYFHAHKKIIAAICYATIVLAQAGILHKKQGTVYPTKESLDIFKQFEVNFVDRGTVTLTQEKIITGQGPRFAKEFSNELVQLLQKS